MNGAARLYAVLSGASEAGKLKAGVTLQPGTGITRKHLLFFPVWWLVPCSAGLLTRAAAHDSFSWPGLPHGLVASGSERLYVVAPQVSVPANEMEVMWPVLTQHHFCHGKPATSLPRFRPGPYVSMQLRGHEKPWGLGSDWH